MRLDQENIFCELSSAPSQGAIGNVVAGGNDTRHPMYLYIKNPLSSGTMTVALQTATDSAFTSAITLASYELSSTSGDVKALLPLGQKAFLRLNATSVSSAAFASGKKMLGALVVDVDI